MVKRYGERVLAVRSPTQLGKLALGMVFLIAVAACGVVALIRRWRGAHEAASFSGGVSPAAARDAYDDRLDEELRDMDA